MALPRPRNSAAALAPPLHGWLTGLRIDLLFIVALLPPLGQALVLQGTRLLPVLAVSIAVAVGWQAVFARSRNQRMGFSSIVPAIAFALVVPADAQLWQVALGISFGAVVGVHLFGGYGWNFLNPVAVAVTFLVFSFPDASYGEAPPVAWEVCVPGAALLLATGIISWRIILAAAGALVIVIYLLPSANIDPFMALAGFAFILIFLACDPVAAPGTNSGRWIYGILVGGLAALGLASGKPQTEVFTSVVLLGGIFAPLIDYGTARSHVWRRRRRHGARHE